MGNRADVFSTLQAVLVTRHEHALIFAQGFDLFFRTAEQRNNKDSVPLPDQVRKPTPSASRRVLEALSQPAITSKREAPREHEIRPSVSDREVLQRKDFAQMSAAEMAEMTQLIAKMELPQA